MRPLLARLSAIGVLGSLSAALPATPAWFPPANAAPSIECGGGVPGTPGVVVVHLLDAQTIPHWSMQLEARAHGAASLAMSGTGTIKIEVLLEGRLTRHTADPRQRASGAIGW